MKLKAITVLVLAMVVVGPSSAEETKKKKKGAKGGRQDVAAQLMKRLDGVTLTDEQTEKIKELGKSFTAKMAEAKKAAGITSELMKKRAEAQKSLKDSGKKGKELMQAVNEAAGFSEAQVKAFEQQNSMRQELMKSILALLTDEQKQNLPASMTRGEGKKGKGKKKKDAA